ncbi:MAG: choice-of-anchor tandem repeat GloVer-containing protein [Candidatus Sulfotelmatobacter sp.]
MSVEFVTGALLGQWRFHAVRSLKKKTGMVLVCAFCAMAAIGSPAQTFTILTSFNGTNGEHPAYGSLLQGGNFTFYGTTSGGGANGDGTIFEVTPQGVLTTQYSFDVTHGANPWDGLLLNVDDTFFGTTVSGGANGDGTVFQFRPLGAVMNTLHSFDGTDGESPYAALVKTHTMNFYGTSSTGGAHGSGTVFEMTPTGTLTTIYSFCTATNCTDGASPIAGMILATNGNLYGTTSSGGAHASGTVFEMGSNDKLTTLYSFCSQTNCTDGADPVAELIQGTDGNFYGTTYEGGTNGYGTVFRITPTGRLTTLHSFGGTDGQYPYASLLQATDGNFYGTTYEGGSNGYGTIFEINSGGTLTTLHSFGGIDGAYPYAGVFQGTDGNFYGTTFAGGANGDGTVFSLSTGLAPFVELVPTSDAVGVLITILGSNLTGASSVRFNGTPATFIIRSTTELKAMVPAGATSGPVEVTIPSGTLTSNVSFQVEPRGAKSSAR